MKLIVTAASVAMAGFCFSAHATVPDNAAVYSTEQSKGSLSTGGKDTYTKTFAVVVANLSDKDFDLAKLCLRAIAPDHQEFKLNKVDEKLTKGTVKKGQPVKGVAVFASDNAAVQQAALIRLSDDCE
ncbi:hypothetical protein BN439_3511 [Erwinia amylovora Ea644]|uniref:DUF4354 family protein n=1 Tax=Erwinia amylovora TaxID=552 RepID=UPI0002CB6A01|nr:DUF4354 family protein [Erwinia amylovora]CCP04534.1 hypothetical protein BN439_3511 [Erwinia amylovora Ea644]CCP08597.1 hypothetical protein BN440_3607 [Erwinia amylovora MR1]